MFPKKFVAVLLSVVLCWTTVGCSSSTESTSSQQNVNNANNNVSATPATTPMSDGKYPVQQAQYNDVNGEYSLMILDTPAGSPPVYRTAELQMASLTEDEVKAGQRTYLEVKDNKPVMHLDPDFKIEYVHNVTEVQTNPQTGQQETVIVRQESSFWGPFAGALAGAAIGNLLFSPQYYVPPQYQPGGVMTGYGGYGTSYNEAVDRYQTKYGEAPAAVSNRQKLRTTGTLRNAATTTRKSPKGTKTTGSGFGSSNLESSGKSPTRADRKPSFGSKSGTRRPAGFGSRRRR